MQNGTIRMCSLVTLMGCNVFANPVMFWHALSFGQNDLWRRNSSTGFCSMLSYERTTLHKVNGKFVA